MITVKSEWNRYYDQVLKDKIQNEDQKILAEIHFYAGAYAMLSVLVSLGRSGIPPEKGAKIVDRMLNECMDFLLSDIYKELVGKDDAAVH